MLLKNLENAVESKKQALILNKSIFTYKLIWVIIGLFPLFVFSQENDAFEKRWQEINKGIKYERSSNPKGPEEEYIAPQEFNEQTRRDNEYEDGPNEEDIIYSREKRYEGGEKNGFKKHINDEESEDVDDYSPPKSQSPKTQNSDNNFDFGDGTFFKYLFILIALVLAVFLIYHFFFKNANKSNPKIETFDYNNTEDINPETIEKSQLEKDLEKAITDEDYRSAIRIYYILLLKSFIDRNFIKWARRKTNTHYLAEMTTNKEFENFNKAVNMYEWTWYGKNIPSKETFERFAAFYDDFLKRLKDE